MQLAWSAHASDIISEDLPVVGLSVKGQSMLFSKCRSHFTQSKSLTSVIISCWLEVMHSGIKSPAMNETSRINPGSDSWRSWMCVIRLSRELAIHRSELHAELSLYRLDVARVYPNKDERFHNSLDEDNGYPWKRHRPHIVIDDVSHNPANQKAPLSWGDSIAFCTPTSAGTVLRIRDTDTCWCGFVRRWEHRHLVWLSGCSDGCGSYYHLSG